MGKIKTLHVKKLAKSLMDNYPDKFTNNYEKNKEEMDKLVEMESKTIRNKVAGYMVHLVRKRMNPPSFETLRIKNTRRGRGGRRRRR